jgi:hypothetical protein
MEAHIVGLRWACSVVAITTFAIILIRYGVGMWLLASFATLVTGLGLVFKDHES